VTLLMGVRGKDGIVLGADQKIMRGGEASYAPKIHPINNVLFATEGLTGLADDFLLLLQQEAALKKGFTSLYEAKTVAEDVVSELTKRYKERLEGDSYLYGCYPGGSRIN
jgi:20S proteasome alpha/beta subunit